MSNLLFQSIIKPVLSIPKIIPHLQRSSFRLIQRNVFLEQSKFHHTSTARWTCMSPTCKPISTSKGQLPLQQMKSSLSSNYSPRVSCGIPFFQSSQVKSLTTRNIVESPVELPSSSSSSSSSTYSEPIQTTHPIVGYWMLGCGALVFGIVVIGGLTRLTESGLSITEWNLIRGMKPPKDENEWQEQFTKYKQTPEYKL